jgi:hypothetical protein
MNIMQEVACKLLVSAIDEAMANINHQIVIIALQRPDRRPEKCLTREQPPSYLLHIGGPCEKRNRRSLNCRNP